ncbi:MAG: hypothetical protein ACLR17_03415 [Enterobacteriaceae bacterium]
MALLPRYIRAILAGFEPGATLTMLSDAGRSSLLMGGSWQLGAGHGRGY